ncbi:hypothetical protein PENSPDRAFT_695732 [Peniophora sp. CONT]|nr:hypothetical protein PENSPDRAFT_695732 [Peniophora sp. CONT]
MVQDQLVLVGQSLTGRALEWYDRETTYPRDSVLDWTLEQLLCGLYERFINVANVNEPTKRYERLKYTASAGVKHFADDIEYWAEQMGIPVEMCKHLLMHKNMSAELTSFRHLVDAAMEYESGELFVRDYIGSSARTHRESSLHAMTLAQRHLTAYAGSTIGVPHSVKTGHDQT